MQKNTNEEIIKKKLEHIGLDLENIPQCLEEYNQIKYAPTKIYDETTYKIYKYVSVNDIEILVTPLERLNDLNEKYKLAVPIFEYLKQDSEEELERFATFLKMLSNLDIDRLEEIEEEQKEYNKHIPFEIKYKDNFIWQVFYSEATQKYFMLFPSNETRTESLFYLIQKKIKAQKSKKDEMIYIPICHEEYSSNILKKSEITDLENYIWLFTNQWPSIYEVYNKEGKPSLEILGYTTVYEKIKSLYKITLDDKQKAEQEYKLIKALFILQAYNENEYKFKTIINNEGNLEFYFNLQKITYEKLTEFVKKEVLRKEKQIDNISEDILVDAERLELLMNTTKKQNEEYLMKEKQIVIFLECKRTFFGRIKYFLKSNKKLKVVKKEEQNNKQENEEENQYVLKTEEIDSKEKYTIEDLLKVCNILDKKILNYKNIQMDIKAQENKRENLEKKIKNATLYINEIENHKKSIFDFWKFTNKDEVKLLNESKEDKEKEKNNKIKKSFDYEKDIEDFGKKMDDEQRKTFSKNECDAIFAIKNDIDTFNILEKQKILKKDEDIIQNKIKELKQDYQNNIDKIIEKDFDIFGNVVEDKTKIKVLNNVKHREIEKDKYKTLDLKPTTTIEEYKENIENYRKLLKESYEKMNAPYDMSLYKISNSEFSDKQYDIYNINPKEEINKIDIEEDSINLFKLNIKENMPMIFYTNIIFYDNYNNTLPLGMDLSTQVLIDLSKFEIKLLSKKEFKINIQVNEFDNQVKVVQVYEYDLERKKK